MTDPDIANSDISPETASADRAVANRTPGVAKGAFTVTEAFFEPLPDEERTAWNQ